MRTTADVVVIGAGVIGSSIALELTRAGRDVVVVDKAGGIGHGSTSASSAIVRFNYSTWAGVATAWESWHCWTHWREHLGHEDPTGLARFHRTGMLVLTSADEPPAGPPPTSTARASPGSSGTPRRSRADCRTWTPAASDRPSPSTPRRSSTTRPAPSAASSPPTPASSSDPQLAAHNLGAAAQAQGARYLLHRLVTGDLAAPPGWLAAAAQRHGHRLGTGGGERGGPLVGEGQRARRHRRRLPGDHATAPPGGPPRPGSDRLQRCRRPRHLDRRPRSRDLPPRRFG